MLLAPLMGTEGAGCVVLTLVVKFATENGLEAVAGRDVREPGMVRLRKDPEPAVGRKLEVEFWEGYSVVGKPPPWVILNVGVTTPEMVPVDPKAVVEFPRG
jgi:hypothetical protein